MSVSAAMFCRGQGIITTIAGSDITYPGSSFSALSASFGQLQGVAVSPIDGHVYFASASRSLIVKFNPTLNSVSIVAGIGVGGYSGDGGPAINAAIDSPNQIAFDAAGSLYIADGGNGSIRKIDLLGVITTVATNLDAPTGVAIAPDNTVYASGDMRVYHVAADGVVSVVAGGDTEGYLGDGGPATKALLSWAQALAFDPSGNLLVVDQFNNRIRRISMTTGIISTIAGNGQSGESVAGPATASPLGGLYGITLDSRGNIFIADGNELARIDTTGTLSILNPIQNTFFLTAPGQLTNALISPSELAFDQAGNLYFTDTYANCLYRSSPAGTIEAVAGYDPAFAIGDTGPGLLAGLNAPAMLGVLPDGSLLIADTYNYRIRRLSPTGIINTVAGNGSVSFNLTPGPALSAAIYQPIQAVSDPAGNIYVATGGKIAKISSAGTLSILTNQTGGNGIAVDLQGNLLVASGGSNTILKVASDGTQSLFAGNGKAGFTGDGGLAVAASLSNPLAVAVDSAGNVYIADFGNLRVRKVSTSGVISTLASGVEASALACDRLGNVYAVRQYGGNDVLMISAGGAISTVVGSGTFGFAGDGGPSLAASLNNPDGVAVDGAGNVYISDRLNNRVRKILAVPPPISVSNAQVTISAPSHGALTQYDVPVSSPVQGLAYSISFATQGGGDWLGFSSLQGQAPGVLSITADPSSLGPGTYKGTVTINSPYANPQTLNIAVTFQVGQAQAASLSLGTQALSFALAGSDAQASAPLIVSNQGGGSISFTASVATATGGSWLQVSPQSGTVTPASPASLSVTVTRGMLPVGTYSGTITVSSTTTGQVVIIPVILAVNPAPQRILLSQTGLTFTAVAQGGAAIPQSIGILNTGSGSMTWSATAATLSGGNWLSLSDNAGTVNQPFLDVSFSDVSVNAQSLASGQYFGSVQVTALGASNSPQSVLVVLNVLPAGSNPGPQLRPTGLVFTGVAGGVNAGSQTVTVANVTSGPVTYGSSVTYVNAGNWIKYLPANATVTPNTPAQITVQPDFTNLGTGVFRAALTLAFDDGSIRNVSILGVVAPPGTTPAGRRESSLVRSGSSEQTSACTPTKLLPIFTQLGTGPSVSTGWPVAVVSDVIDDCGNPMTSGSVVVSFTDGDPPLSMISLGNGQWSGTWTPQSSNPAGVTVSSGTAGEFDGKPSNSGRISRSTVLAYGFRRRHECRHAYAGTTRAG